ncbi:hypothetical protein M3I54_28460 [Paraburkholderia sp. CNPSo 3274]|uniref:hypothetical protein n=1 Tax=Paraburkholderia sp. CNPSo 3274 TaxID=2940932 RepID=UPI0020B8887F|nr:hypothetical protein [Paraburkholderia sp. CNPSo 3274]MCP3710862.1 hypothetical protein [Paraburkholderia sp. CNPSo 3274]
MSASRLHTPFNLPSRLPASRVTILAAIAVAFSLPTAAFAQTAEAATVASGAAATGNAGNATLPTVKVQASQETLPGDLQPTFGGGHVARGGDFGVLGSQKNIDVPCWPHRNTADPYGSSAPKA